MKAIKPGALLMMGGGLLLFICTFLAWKGFEGSDESINGFETDAFGFLGIWVFLIAIAVTGIVAALAFAGVKLPENILGFSVNQWLFIDSLLAFLIMIGLLSTGGRGFETKVGMILGALAAAAMLAGAFMEMRGIGSPINIGSATAAAPPGVPGAATPPPAAAPGTIPAPPAGAAEATPPPAAPPAAPEPPSAPGTPPPPPA